ncbi:MAG: hypothetical protein ABI203_10000, partial [Mucilaginibacter sp.]
MLYILGRIFCAVALCVGFTPTASAQAYRQLTVDDFQGRAQSRTGVIAYTNCTIDFRYQAHRKNDYYLLDFDIKLMMNSDRSWMNKARVT